MTSRNTKPAIPTGNKLSKPTTKNGSIKSASMSAQKPRQTPAEQQLPSNRSTDITLPHHHRQTRRSSPAGVDDQ
ncbi:hypothetical protein ACFQFR_38660 [Streptomyces goshikiensis]